MASLAGAHLHLLFAGVLVEGEGKEKWLLSILQKVFCFEL